MPLYISPATDAKLAEEALRLLHSFNMNSRAATTPLADFIYREWGAILSMMGHEPRSHRLRDRSFAYLEALKKERRLHSRAAVVSVQEIST